jgi:alpha-beta hydrolase superfamily lysophospholipase
MGGGGGGTYGGYNVFGKLAAELPRQGIAVLLLHYPEGNPGAPPLQGGISKTVEHAERLIEWFGTHVGSKVVPIALVGWSMGGAVAIEVAANGIRMKNMNIKGVGTIASMKDVARTSPGIIVDSGADLLLLHNVSEDCNASNSHRIAKLAGIEPMLFHGENHAVKSAFGVLLQWLPRSFQKSTGYC